eukprot:6188337-Pleurochrysis_carterae.AAC.1
MRVADEVPAALGLGGSHDGAQRQCGRHRQRAAESLHLNMLSAVQFRQRCIRARSEHEVARTEACSRGQQAYTRAAEEVVLERVRWLQLSGSFEGNTGLAYVRNDGEVLQC